jgi:hypothetical protein
MRPSQMARLINRRETIVFMELSFRNSFYLRDIAETSQLLLDCGDQCRYLVVRLVWFRHD